MTEILSSHSQQVEDSRYITPDKFVNTLKRDDSNDHGADVLIDQMRWLSPNAIGVENY